MLIFVKGGLFQQNIVLSSYYVNIQTVITPGSMPYVSSKELTAKQSLAKKPRQISKWKMST